MSELTKKINQFFRLATRKEVQEIKDKIYISEHLEQVFNMYYIQKKSIQLMVKQKHFLNGAKYMVCLTKECM